MDDCTSTFHSGCNVDRIPAPCLARCRRDDCEAGCTRGGLYIDSGTSSYDDISLFIGGVSLQPQLPPNVTNIGNTLHRVSTGAGEPVVLPIFSSVLNQVVPYSTVILRVTGPASDGSIEKFYVLDDSNEVDLDDFACQAVNISFALVTVNYGMSDFSPPLNFEVLNVPMIMDYPDQLTVEDISHTVEQDNRVGFFQYHLIHVSWNLPNNYQFATGYRLSLITPMIELCGLGEGATVNLENRTITEYTFQVSTRCSYILSVEVVPKDPSDEVVQIGILTGDYMVPTSSDIALNCDASPTPAGTYDITINVQLNDTFTPVVMAAIDYFQLFRLESDIADDGGIPTVSELPILTRINGSEILQTTAVDEGVLPLDPLRQYEYEVTVSFGEIPRLDIITTIQTSCFLRDLGHIPLPPPGPQDINILTLNVSALDTNSYPVLIEFNFVYEQGDRGESLEMFHVWFNEVRAPEGSDLRPEMYTQLGALEREDSLQYTVMTSEEMFSVYLQIRVVTANTISAWSDPVIRLLTVDETLPDPVTDQQFNITEFTYSTSLNPLGELQVQVQIEIIHLILRSVTVEEFQVCVNPEILASDEEDISVCSASITFNAIRSGSDASLQPVSPTNTILLPRLGVRLYIQVRAINPGDLAGNWSEPEIISVDDIPPPTQITPIVRELSSMFDEDGMLVYTLDMFVSWVAPAGVGRRKRQNDPVMTAEMEVTKYVVVVGPEEIEEPYGPVPMSSIQRDINVGSSDVIIREDIDLDDPTNSSSPIIYVQMRSVAGGASGSWSEAIAIPVTPESDSSLSTVLGIAIPVGLVAGVLLFIFVFIVVYFACRQYKVHKSVKSDGDVGKGFDLWKDNYTDVHFIPEGLVEGKELVVDEWEIPTSDVIVENHLGEGAFGLVFKGVISAPLRNPKLSSKLRQTIGLPVAIKLLKETATNKERKDFWVEIDMMKKISEGYCNNIVNMVGCVTLQEPLCLITEFVPHGDLLDYLRNQRKKNASRNREEKYLRIQLEQQRKAYEDMKRQMEILQSAQSDAPGEDRLLAGGSGYADFPSVDNENAPPTTVTPTSDQPAPVTSPTSSDESPTADQPLLPPGTTSPYTDFSSEGSVLSPATGTSGFDSELLPIQEGEEGEGEEKGTEEAESGKRYEASGPSPYLESNNEYSHLDPSPTNPPEAAAQEPEEEEDVYGELGDLDGNDLMQFAYQIATGMEYLASINIVHRDLACRNILVGEGKNLKITDFGLSREVEDVYVKKTKGRLPLKWMALESIEAREFTTCSDVWSFGVVLWEIGTMGGFPYPTIQNQDLLMMLKQGYRLEKPDNCAPEVYDIMLECWQEHPEDRPTFSNLREKFSNLLLATTGDAYMELEVDNSKVYYTMDDEESRERRDSTSSEDSDDSTIKKPKNKKIEKPKWANTNAYAPMPSTFKDDHVHVEDEHYRVRADIEEQKEELITENGIGSDANAPDTELFPPHAPLSSSISCPPTQLSATPILLEDQMGIPLSFVPGEKPSQPSSHVPLKKTRTNPYVDDPATKQLLPDESAENGVSKIGSLTAELNMRLESGENITAL